MSFFWFKNVKKAVMLILVRLSIHSNGILNIGHANLLKYAETLIKSRESGILNWLPQ